MVPRRTTNLGPTDELPFGMTHPNDTPCPFANDDVPRGYINTCCSFNTDAATKNLDALKKKALARLLHEDIGEEPVLAVAKELRLAADAIEGRYVESADTDDSRGEGGVIDIATEKFTPWSRPRFEEALASIRKAADWYEKVGRLGFGVEVWF